MFEQEIIGFFLPAPQPALFIRMWYLTSRCDELSNAAQQQKDVTHSLASFLFPSFGGGGGGDRIFFSLHSDDTFWHQQLTGLTHTLANFLTLPHARECDVSYWVYWTWVTPWPGDAASLFSRHQKWIGQPLSRASGTNQSFSLATNRKNVIHVHLSSFFLLRTKFNLEKVIKEEE